MTSRFGGWTNKDHYALVALAAKVAMDPTDLIKLALKQFEERFEKT